MIGEGRGRLDAHPNAQTRGFRLCWGGGFAPVEEARALQAMLNERYTMDRAAQALGVEPSDRDCCAKILKRPEVGRSSSAPGDPGQRDQ